jgi:hypothetical protein
MKYIMTSSNQLIFSYLKHILVTLFLSSLVTGYVLASTDFKENFGIPTLGGNFKVGKINHRY